MSLSCKADALLSPEMPSANTTTSSRRSAPYSVPARNEVTGLRERITLSKASKAKFTNVGKPRKVVQPRHTPLIKRLDPEYRAMIAEDQREHDESLARKCRWAEEIQQKTLFERLNIKKAEKLSLLQRIELEDSPLDLSEAYNIPAKKIRKHSTDKRHDEYAKMANATDRRLTTLCRRIVEEGYDLTQHPDKVVRERYESVTRLVDYVYQVAVLFKDKDKTRHFTNRDWRKLKVDFKAIGRVSLDNLDRNWDFIAKSLAEIEAGGAFNYLF